MLENIPPYFPVRTSGQRWQSVCAPSDSRNHRAAAADKL